VAGAIGSTGVELLGAAWGEATERRMNDWLDRTGEQYEQLSSNVDSQQADLDEQRSKLDEQQETIDDIRAQATQLRESLGDGAFAILNHIVSAVRRASQEEKLEQLSNAALHILLGDAPEDTLRDILVSLLDDLTVLHIKLLRFILHPGDYGIVYPDDPSRPLVDYQDLHVAAGKLNGIPDLIAEHISEVERRDLLELCTTDLVNRGLLVIMSNEPSSRWMISPRPTQLADEFMAFITAPKSRSEADQNH
jgi:hypothetical protein